MPTDSVSHAAYASSRVGTVDPAHAIQGGGKIHGTSFRESFHVDDLEFLFVVSATNEITFFQIREDPLAWWDFGSDGRYHDMLRAGNCRNPVRLFRMVMDLTLKWIRMARPKHFRFGTPDPQKARIYDRLVRRVEAATAGRYVYAPWGGEFWFYRIVRDPA